MGQVKSLEITHVHTKLVKLDPSIELQDLQRNLKTKLLFINLLVRKIQLYKLIK